MNIAEDKLPKQALSELRAILEKPYQDVCNVCSGVGKIAKSNTCPKCKGSGQRMLKLI